MISNLYITTLLLRGSMTMNLPSRHWEVFRPWSYEARQPQKRRSATGGHEPPRARSLRTGKAFCATCQNIQNPSLSEAFGIAEDWGASGILAGSCVLALLAEKSEPQGVPRGRNSIQECRELKIPWPAPTGFYVGNSLEQRNQETFCPTQLFPRLRAVVWSKSPILGTCLLQWQLSCYKPWQLQRKDEGCTMQGTHGNPTGRREPASARVLGHPAWEIDPDLRHQVLLASRCGCGRLISRVQNAWHRSLRITTRTNKLHVEW